MVEFDFRRPGRLCSVANRPLLPGERFVSALIEQPDGTLVRTDTSEQAWTGPPEHCVGWWRCRMPELQPGKVHWAPREVLLAVFQHALASSQNDVAWVMGLLLVRKRILQCRDEGMRPGEPLVLVDPRGNQQFEVPDCTLSPDRIGAIQKELEEKLFTDSQLPDLADAEEA